jgi:cell division protein FtsL
MDPLEFDIDKKLQEAKLKIDSKAVKNVTNKKILDVFGQEEFTKLEKLVILLMCGTLAVSAINLVLNALVLFRSGGI